MLFVTESDKKTLKDLVFQKHKKITSDELLILSGYIGNTTVKELHDLGIKVKLIYGLAKQEKIDKIFYDDLCKLHGDNVAVYCPDTVSHAKIYIWKYKGEVVYILNGSANFTATGLNTPYKEVLSEVERSSFSDFEGYYSKILDSSVPIVNIDEKKFLKSKMKPYNFAQEQKKDLLHSDPNICVTDSIYEQQSKINWGHGNAHTNRRDAYIPIRVKDVRQYPHLFPEKLMGKGLGFNDNLPIDILWDDGENMVGLLEGNLKIDDKRYPNKIASFKSKKILGDYLRKRIGLAPGEFVTKKSLELYGRDNISISLISEGVYYFDFSV